jgi:exonuclease VII large subunit
MNTYLNGFRQKTNNLFGRLEQSSDRKILEKGFCLITDSKGNTIKTKFEFGKSSKDDLLINFIDGETKINAVA